MTNQNDNPFETWASDEMAKDYAQVDETDKVAQGVAQALGADIIQRDGNDVIMERNGAKIILRSEMVSPLDLLLGGKSKASDELTGLLGLAGKLMERRLKEYDGFPCPWCNEPMDRHDLLMAMPTPDLRPVHRECAVEIIDWLQENYPTEDERQKAFVALLTKNARES